MAKRRGDEYYSEELGQEFITDDSHVVPENSERYYHERTMAYIRVIKFIESYLMTGQADWTPSMGSLGAHLPGLKIFLQMNDHTNIFLYELPEHLPKKRDILKIYSDEEYEKILNHLNNAENMSLRNKALTIIALDTGLRAVDICNLKTPDIDWEHDCIHIIQQKTGHAHNIPLSERIGNALIEYMLNERPVSESDFVFLRGTAPFNPLMSHAGVRNVLFHAVNDAEVKADGRIYGSRITRHSTASRMLRNGIPLSVISDALGHENPNSVMIYLTTDDAKLAECTLPLPGGDHHE